MTVVSLDLAGDLAGLSPREVVEFREGVELFGERRGKGQQARRERGKEKIDDEQEGQSSLWTREMSVLLSFEPSERKRLTNGKSEKVDEHPSDVDNLESGDEDEDSG